MMKQRAEIDVITFFFSGTGFFLCLCVFFQVKFVLYYSSEHNSTPII